MSQLTINGVSIHYELDGSGTETLVILNGIMMSTESWTAFIPDWGKHYQLLRLDFRDQGSSEKMTEAYDIDVHAEDLNCLLEALCIRKAHLLGISYGGEVAMLFALKYPEKVDKLILSNTTARVSPHLRAIGKAWEEAALSYNGETFFKLAMPFIYSPHFYESHHEWLLERERLFGKILQKPWFEGYIRLSQSTHSYAILESIKAITAKTLCIASDQDMVTPVSELELICKEIPNAQIAVIPGAGHASCYEKSEVFGALVLGFLIS